MADYAVPRSGVAYIYYGCLVSQADTKLFKSVPTLAAGDFKVSIDGGAFANMATLPTNTPGTFAMKFSLSASEMTGDNILVVASDAAGAEWCDQCWNIQTSPRGIADLAFPATSGRSMVVDASGLVDANAVKLGPTGAGTAQTARDVGLSVLLSTGTGTGQLDFTSGVVKANLAQILGTALTETAGQIAAAFKKFFDIASPTSTMNVITLVTTTTTATNLTNAPTNGDLTAVMKTSVTTAATAATPTAAAVTGAVGSVTGLTASNLDATISSRATPAQVKTQVVDGLNTDTYAEPAQGAPGATITLAAKIGFLYKAFRNKKTQTATTLSIFNDDAVTVDHKATVSDDNTTFTSGEVASGP